MVIEQRLMAAVQDDGDLVKLDGVTCVLAPLSPDLVEGLLHYGAEDEDLEPTGDEEPAGDENEPSLGWGPNGEISTHDTRWDGQDLEHQQDAEPDNYFS